MTAEEMINELRKVQPTTEVYYPIPNDASTSATLCGITGMTFDMEHQQVRLRTRPKGAPDLPLR
jgi:hypothetical protein